MNDYILKAAFMKYFDDTLMMPIIIDVALESMTTVIMGGMIEEMVTKEANELGDQIIRTTFYQEMKRESDLIFKLEAEKTLVDQLTFETLFDELQTDFEETEKKLVERKEKELEEYNQMKSKILEYKWEE
jgi:hypothetical protein